MKRIQNKIKSGFVIVTVVVSASGVWAQDSITFIPSWKAGDSHNYIFSRLRQDYTNDTLYSSSTFDYTVSLTATRSQPEESELTLIYKGKSKDYKVLKKTPDKFVLANALEYLTIKLYGFSSLKVVYTIDARGTFLGIKNKNELRNYISSVLTAAKHDQQVTPDFAGVLEQLKPTLLSDDYVEYSFLPEIQFYHLLYSKSWKPGRQQNEIEVPNPVTGEGLPGILTAEVKKVAVKKPAPRKELPTYEIVMQQKLDQARLMKAMQETAHQTGIENNGTPPIDFNAVYRYTVKDHLIKKASYIKTVVSAESKSVEEFLIRPVIPGAK